MSESAHQHRSGPSSVEPESTSSSLVDRVKARDGDAWRRLVDLYGPVVYGWCRRAGLRPEDAADAGQEVFSSVARGIAEFRHDQPGQTFRGWLWTITRNKIHDHFRALGRQPAAVGGSDFQQFLSHLPTDSADRSSAVAPDPPAAGLCRRALELIRSDFEDRTWQAFWLVTVEGQSPTDVAAQLGMTPTAVRKAKSRVLQRLRQELGELTDHR